MNIAYLVFRKFWQDWKLKHYRKMVAQACEREGAIQGLSEEQIRQTVQELHQEAQANRDLRGLIPRALAVGREVSRRKLKMRHYDVQLLGTLALYEGHIAEMNTGEGKTLMAPLACFLHRLGNPEGCTHIVTANEYLAARDAAWMKPLYEGLGMTVGLVVPGQAAAERMEAYQKDVVYATAKEIVFDFLRRDVSRRKTSAVDAILRPQAEIVFDPKYDFAIVDEVDSVLIDQAQSPLSLGAESGISPQLALYQKAEETAGKLVRGKHYRLMHDDRKVELKEEGKAEARELGKEVLRYLPSGHRWERYVVCALAARYIYKRDQHYVVHQNKIVLIDESTGRMLPGRQLQDGLHQAMEVHNGLTPSTELKGSHTTTFQTFFRKYKKLAGMTGTASSAAFEFLNVYQQCIVPIPPNKPVRRYLHPDRVYRSPKRKYDALAAKIESVHATGRPILIGTGSVQISERISEMLTERKLEHDVLNAKNHAREAEIIAKAGEAGKSTVITNMAGRGVDILLGKGVADKGGR